MTLLHFARAQQRRLLSLARDRAPAEPQHARRPAALALGRRRPARQRQGQRPDPRAHHVRLWRPRRVPGQRPRRAPVQAGRREEDGLRGSRVLVRCVPSSRSCGFLRTTPSVTDERSHPRPQLSSASSARATRSSCRTTTTTAGAAHGRRASSSSSSSEGQSGSSRARARAGRKPSCRGRSRSGSEEERAAREGTVRGPACARWRGERLQRGSCRAKPRFPCGGRFESGSLLQYLRRARPGRRACRPSQVAAGPARRPRAVGEQGHVIAHRALNPRAMAEGARRPRGGRGSETLGRT